MIRLLASHFVAQGHQVLNCEEDVNTQIVREALDVAAEKKMLQLWLKTQTF